MGAGGVEAPLGGLGGSFVFSFFFFLVLFFLFSFFSKKKKEKKERPQLPDPLSITRSLVLLALPSL